MRRTIVAVATGAVALGAISVFIWNRGGRFESADPPHGAPAASSDGSRALPGPAGRGEIIPGADSSEAVAPSESRTIAHPLLADAEAVVCGEGIGGIKSTSSPELKDLVHTLSSPSALVERPAAVTVDYPLDESMFPPGMVPPTFLWHDAAEPADTWLFDAAFPATGERLRVLVPGVPPPQGEIDEAAMAESNEVYKPTPYQASARSWTPSADVWASIQKRCREKPAEITVLGLSSGDPEVVVSRGRLSITTSKDPVDSPIFYRDVPLAPSQTEPGVIKPLGDSVVPRIAWRLRDISKPESRLLLTNMITCTNCHSFSADGKTLGMDLDGPNGDKGAYVIAPVSKRMVIERKHVISWNSFPEQPEGHNTIGFLSRISPDGQYVATTLNESVFVANFWDFTFLQVFYPTRGILAFYRRATGEIKALPGADDPDYVHCDPVWSPDGETLVFARAKAVDPYPEGRPLPSFANDPAETPIQYDLYRIPFNDGRGGEPEPIAGASANGMSNTFPKVSPDGKWIVFVQCRNGQLLRPDSKLWIVPFEGGEARLMRCNTRLLNSWHSFSPNGRWLVFSSKSNTPYTQMFLTHLDDRGNDSPAVLIPNSTAANRAVNLPEFVNIPYEGLADIAVPAIQHLRDALRGRELLAEGKLDEALGRFDSAVRSEPDYVDGHVTAAVILVEKGRLDEATAHLEKALAIDPECWHAHANLGVILLRQGRAEDALDEFRKGVALKPDHFEARANLAKTLLEMGRAEDARSHFEASVDLAPDDAASHVNLGDYLFSHKLFDLAAQQYAKALASYPELTRARLMLGQVRAEQGDPAAAAAEFRTACTNDPKSLQAVNALASFLATCPAEEVRDGAEAVSLAEAACKATGHRDPVLLTTLAAAYAEVGRWPDAIAAATEALGLAEPQNAQFADEIRRHLERYRQQKPLR